MDMLPLYDVSDLVGIASLRCHVIFGPSPTYHSENGVEDEEDLYDYVYDDDEGGEVYEDLMKAEAVPPPV